MAIVPRPKVLSLDAARTERLYLILLELLESYCMEEADSAERERALDRFFGGGADFANLPEPTQDEFLDWFAFAYRTEQTGETMLELFAAEHERLTGQAVPPSLYKSRFGLFEVVEQKGYRLTLTDRLTEEQFPLLVEGAPPPSKGSLLCGRIVPLGEVWRPGFTLDTIPTDFFPAFQPLLQIELDRMRLAFPEATWSELLRERWPFLRDVMLMRLEHDPRHLDVPDLPPAPTTEGEVSKGVLAVAMRLQLFHARLGLACEDAERLIRFWYDAAAVLAPNIRQPLLWAAGTAWAFHRWVEEMPFSQEEIAEEFGIAPTSLVRKGREIIAALSVVDGDQRYTDPLASLPRMKRLAYLFGPEAMDTLYE
jgi:hypothetical protein